MKNEVKVLKDGMTVAELRAADLENVCDLEKELIEVILDAYKNEANDFVIDFEKDKIVTLVKMDGKRYINCIENDRPTTIKNAIYFIKNGVVPYGVPVVVEKFN